MACFLMGALARSTNLYWVIGALVGTSLGSTWVVSRALIARIASKDEMGKIFGMFQLVAYLSGMVGSGFWGLILLILAPLGDLRYRIALGSLSLFVLIGLVFLLRIPNLKKQQD